MQNQRCGLTYGTFCAFAAAFSSATWVAKAGLGLGAEQLWTLLGFDARQ